MSSHEVGHRWNLNLILTARSAKARKIEGGLGQMARKAREPNPCGKRRDPKDPYEVWIGKVDTHFEDWEYHVLKKYLCPTSEAKNPHARWHCAVYSPITYAQMVDGFELGDVYASHIKAVATLKQD